MCQERVFKDQRALYLGAVGCHAGAAHVVTVAVTGLDEGVATIRTFVTLLLPVCFLVVNHIAELRCLNVTFEASEKLVSASRSLIDHVMLFEAHVARIWTVAISHPLLNSLT